MTALFEDADDDGTSTEATTESSRSQNDSLQRKLVRVTVGGEFEEAFKYDSDELLFEKDDDGEELLLSGTDFEEVELEALEEAFDYESFQFDLNYLPARIFRKLGVNEWLDGKPEHFIPEEFSFHLSSFGGVDFVSLR
ncbi:hypothetical protein [Paenibacillus piri]|uniref:Uncharacterized protein n=1 Tax=Paenibacillus piri TaxID=2547395 RepID=A0A4V2ZRU1_9BACL|nr:hypothetical protein [Paenibacillus piri]TDF88859.1 hypothetical protein E1757_35110 [Paenibacillus piri]